MCLTNNKIVLSVIVTCYNDVNDVSVNFIKEKLWGQELNTRFSTLLRKTIQRYGSLMDYWIRDDLTIDYRLGLSYFILCKILKFS